jgi:hypothetical protein
MNHIPITSMPAEQICKCFCCVNCGIDPVNVSLYCAKTQGCVFRFDRDRLLDRSPSVGEAIWMKFDERTSDREFHPYPWEEDST